MPSIPERVKAVLLVVIVIVAATGLFAVASAFYPAAAPSVVHDVSLRIEGPGWVRTYAATITPNGTAFAFLLEAADRLGFGVLFTRYAPPLDSVLVDAINGTRSGEGGLWWQYWVDGSYGDVGADRKVLRDGSAVLWAFEPYPPEVG